MTRRGIGRLAGMTVIALLAIGCGYEEPSDPHDLLAEAQAPVSGTLDAKTVTEVLSQYDLWQLWETRLAKLGGIDTQKAMECSSGPQNAATIDLMCASPGVLLGTIALVVDAPVKDRSIVTATLHGACTPEACADGTLVFDMPAAASAFMELPSYLVGAGDTWAASLDVNTPDNEKAHIHRGQNGRGVYFDSSGLTYLAADAPIDPAIPHVAISAINGDFVCSREGKGGKCDGPTPFDYVKASP